MPVDLSRQAASQSLNMLLNTGNGSLTDIPPLLDEL